MDQARRRAVVTALIHLASSADYRDRADAGRALAGFAEATESQDLLLRLVLDGGDTFVTWVTAEALLRRRDITGFRIIAEALITADLEQLTYMQKAVDAVFGVYASDRDLAVQACEPLLLDTSAQVRKGAAKLRGMLAQIGPVLFPRETDWRALLAHDDVELQQPASGDTLAHVEGTLGVVLPADLRALYSVTDGVYSRRGQWFVIWPLATMLERNSSDWAGWASEARQRLIGFGDDGTGDPYCVSRDGSNCVYVWHPIGQEVYGVADTIQDFWIGWIHGTIKN